MAERKPFLEEREYLKKRLTQYLEGEITLKQFYRWFMSFARQMDDDLINLIKLRLYEYTSLEGRGTATEETLKSLLREALDEHKETH